MHKVKLIITIILGICIAAQAQEFKIGADFVSRYVWRGIDFGNSAAAQPTLSFSWNNFTIGEWASYSFSAESFAADENDRWLSSSISTPFGTFAPTLNDYYYPNAGGKFFNFDGDGEGAHVLEGVLSYSGVEGFPIGITAAYNFHNDVDNSAYFELSYPVAVKETNVSVFMGFATGSSAWYGIASDNPQMINCGIAASKTIEITDKFSVPVGVGLTINPYAEKAYLVFKATI